MFAGPWLFGLKMARFIDMARTHISSSLPMTGLGFQKPKIQSVTAYNDEPIMLGPARIWGSQWPR
jgi:hypothetical protein